MNIFRIDNDPARAARQLVDKHVVKMILESAQLLSTAHRLLDGELYFETKETLSGSRQIKRWRLSDAREGLLYSATHINHPCAIWCRENAANYNWLYDHFCANLGEYKYRYDKVHKIERDGLDKALSSLPTNIAVSEHETPMKPAMDASYVISTDIVENYRNYYAVGKSHLHSWKLRDRPEWIDKYT